MAERNEKNLMRIPWEESNPNLVLQYPIDEDCVRVVTFGLQKETKNLGRFPMQKNYHYRLKRGQQYVRT